MEDPDGTSPHRVLAKRKQCECTALVAVSPSRRRDTPVWRPSPDSCTTPTSREIIPLELQLVNSPVFNEGQWPSHQNLPDRRPHSSDNDSSVLQDDTRGRTYTITKHLGSGSFAECVKVVESTTGRVWAAKLLPKRRLSPAQKRRFKRLTPEMKASLLQVDEEIAIHSSLNHAGIVGFDSWFADRQSGKLVIVMDYCRHGTLRQVLRHFPGRILPTAIVQRWSIQILSALKYLHDIPVLVAHRDLNPDNLLVDEDLRLRISDFGLATRLGEDGLVPGEVIPHSCGTVNYIAPEVVLEHRGCDLRRADIWSTGVILYEVLVGRVPFALDGPSEQQEDIAEHLLPGTALDVLSAEMIGMMLNRDPRARPTAHQLLTHTFLQDQPVCGTTAAQSSPQSLLTNERAEQKYALAASRLVLSNSSNAHQQLQCTSSAALVSVNGNIPGATQPLLLTADSNIPDPLRLDLTSRSWSHTLGSIDPHGDLRWIRAASTWARNRRSRSRSFIQSDDESNEEETEDSVEDECHPSLLQLPYAPFLDENTSA